MEFRDGSRSLGRFLQFYEEQFGGKSEELPGTIGEVQCDPVGVTRVHIKFGGLRGFSLS